MRGRPPEVSVNPITGELPSYANARRRDPFAPTRIAPAAAAGMAFLAEDQRTVMFASDRPDRAHAHHDNHGHSHAGRSRSPMGAPTQYGWGVYVKAQGQNGSSNSLAGERSRGLRDGVSVDSLAFLPPISTSEPGSGRQSAARPRSGHDVSLPAIGPSHVASPGRGHAHAHDSPRTKAMLSSGSLDDVGRRYVDTAQQPPRTPTGLSERHVDRARHTRSPDVIVRRPERHVEAASAPIVVPAGAVLAPLYGRPKLVADYESPRTPRQPERPDDRSTLGHVAHADSGDDVIPHPPTSAAPANRRVIGHGFRRVHVPSDHSEGADETTGHNRSSEVPDSPHMRSYGDSNQGRADLGANVGEVDESVSLAGFYRREDAAQSPTRGESPESPYAQTRRSPPRKSPKAVDVREASPKKASPSRRSPSVVDSVDSLGRSGPAPRASIEEAPNAPSASTKSPGGKAPLGEEKRQDDPSPTQPSVVPVSKQSSPPKMAAEPGAFREFHPVARSTDVLRVAGAVDGAAPSPPTAAKPPKPEYVASPGDGLDPTDIFGAAFDDTRAQHSIVSEVLSHRLEVLRACAAASVGGGDAFVAHVTSVGDSGIQLLVDTAPKLCDSVRRAATRARKAIVDGRDLSFSVGGEEGVEGLLQPTSVADLCPLIGKLLLYKYENYLMAILTLTSVLLRDWLPIASAVVRAEVNRSSENPDGLDPAASRLAGNFELCRTALAALQAPVKALARLDGGGWIADTAGTLLPLFATVTARN